LIEEQPFFRGLSSSQFETLASLAMGVHFSAGEYVFRQQDPANRFYLILEGRVELEPASIPPPQASLQFVTAGDCLGWSWMFEPYAFYVSARAVESTRAIFFYGTRLRQYCEDDPHFGYEVVKRVAGAVVKTMIAFQPGLAKNAGPRALPGSFLYAGTNEAATRNAIRKQTRT
jgi:CRP-like cAMP-binding protein